MGKIGATNYSLVGWESWGLDWTSRPFWTASVYLVRPWIRHISTLQFLFFLSTVGSGNRRLCAVYTFRIPSWLRSEFYLSTRTFSCAASLDGLQIASLPFLAPRFPYAEAIQKIRWFFFGLRRYSYLGLPLSLTPRLCAARVFCSIGLGGLFFLLLLLRFVWWIRDFHVLTGRLFSWLCDCYLLSAFRIDDIPGVWIFGVWSSRVVRYFCGELLAV